MPVWAWILIAIGILVVIGAVMFAVIRRDRSKNLKQTFGPEYDRTVAEHGGRKDAERDLLERTDRRSELDIRPLAPQAAEEYAAQWLEVQGRFVDEPSGAVIDADRLVTDVMRDRGYPMEDFDRQADVISVDHPGVVEDYRHAHEIFLAHGRGEAQTEDLRQAMVHYRSLFEELLGQRRAVTTNTGEAR